MLMKQGRIVTLLLLLILGRVGLSLGQAHDNPLYAPMTFPIAIDPTLYRNPFDSNDIELVGVFESPSGKQVVIPGFWMQPYADQCQQPCKVDDLKPSGSPTWQVRFAPDEVGHWSYNLQVRDDGTTIKVENGSFDVAPSDHPGFIHVSLNQRYFRYDNGQSYFPIGHNLLSSWDAGGGLVAYRKWLQALSAAGGNYARLLIDDPWFIGLEWNGAAGDYRASQREAARLDVIIEMAEQYGISLQLVLLWHQALINYQGAPVVIPANPPHPDMSADWDNYGYNVLNGGFMNGPALFFSDDRAKVLFRQRLRYIAARWGDSPQVFAWEMIDEIDHTTNYTSSVASDWLNDMGGYMRQIDQGRHLITAGSRSYDPVVESNSALSFTQARFYQRRPFETVADQVVGALGSIRQNLQLVHSPTLLTEFSLNPWFQPTSDDPDGISVQTTLWASAFSGAGGGAMSAYGETYVSPLSLQRYYPPLAAFAAAVDWANLDLQPAEATLLNDDNSIYQPLRISGFSRHSGGTDAPSVTHVISADAVVPDLSAVPSMLYGMVANHNLHRAQQYHVAVPHATTFEARIRASSLQGGSLLVITVDGRTAAELVLDPGSKNVAVRVPLSVGEHDITLENLGDDWLELDTLEIAQFVTPVRMLTLRDSGAGVAVSWLQNRAYSWDHIKEARPKLLFTYRIDQMPAGRYTVEIWDPLSGGVIGSEVTRVDDDGVLMVDLVPMDTELALRIVRQPDDEPDSTEAATSPLGETGESTVNSVGETRIPTITRTLFTIVTNTPAPTATATDTLTPSVTPTAPLTDTHTPTFTATRLPSATATLLSSSSPTVSATATPSATKPPTSTLSVPFRATLRPSPSASPTATKTS